MGWSESYWEDVKADWTRLQSERRPAGEHETADRPAPTEPESTPEFQTVLVITDLAE